MSALLSAVISLVSEGADGAWRAPEGSAFSDWIGFPGPMACAALWYAGSVLLAETGSTVSFLAIAGTVEGDSCRL